ncbi:MAG: hypothetical protein NTZ74_05160 [Chloroflexi bacterium]|nr:hypothetical protein [Chloroflexota bacterium]
MKKGFIKLCFGIILVITLSSCDLSKSLSSPIITDISQTDSVPYSVDDIQNAESCWLQSYNIKLGEWVGNHQCTALARLLTTAPGYGNDANGDALGGYDYVKQKHNNGIHIPLLAEVKNDLQTCDNLILVGPKYNTAGHTVVVFYVDRANDTIFYLDQNYNDEPMTPRKLRISENGNNIYVIPATCKQSVNQTCFSSVEITRTPVIFITENPELVLDQSDFKSVVEWFSTSINKNQLNMITSIIGENGVEFMSFGQGAIPLGYNNSEEIITEIQKALNNSSPKCIGYNDTDFGSEPEKAIIIYSGVNFDWKKLGIDQSGNDTVGFQFYKNENVWDLIWITPIPDDYWADFNISLTNCP